MAITSIARVTIHRIRISDAHSVAGEPGSTAEWNLAFFVNGQFKLKRIDVPLSAGLISPGFDVELDFNFVVPLLAGKVIIRVFGDEIDDTTANDKISPIQRIHRPAEEFPLGAGWISSSVYNLLEGDGDDWFPYEPGTETIGGYTIWYSIMPFAADWEDKREYFPLIRTGPSPHRWYVHDWEGFTKNQDAWFRQGWRLRRVSTHLTGPSVPRFADTAARTFMGIYTEGTGRWEFWLMPLADFTTKYHDLRKLNIRCDDIYCYRENDTVMLGGSFSGDGPLTELVVLPEEKFVRDRETRKANGQCLVSIDTYHDGRMRWFVGLFEKGGYKQAFKPSLRWNDFLHSRNELTKLNFRVEDYCLHNDGGEVRISTVWREGYIRQEWLLREKGLLDLETRVNYNVAMGRHILSLDSWAEDDPE
jgi:hypothetical protein